MLDETPSDPKHKSEQINGWFNLTGKIAAAIGGFFVMAYAVQEGFFPQLLASITLPMLAFLIFLGAGSVFVVGVSVIAGAAATYWILALLVLVIARDDERPSSSLIPPKVCDRVFLVLMSLIFFVSLFLMGKYRVPPSQHHDLVVMYATFMFSGGFLQATFMTRREFWQPLPVIVTVLFVFPQVRPIILDLPMSFLGFRSHRNDLVIVTDRGFQSLYAEANESGASVLSCQFREGTEQRWLIEEAVVVWSGIGKHSFLRASKQGVESGPILTVPSTELTVLSGALEAPCV